MRTRSLIILWAILALIACFAGFAMAGQTATPQPMTFFFKTMTSKGILTGSSEILRGAPKRDYVKNPSIRCMAYQLGSIKDKNGKLYNVYQYTGEQYYSSDWHRRMGIAR